VNVVAYPEGRPYQSNKKCHCIETSAAFQILKLIILYNDTKLLSNLIFHVLITMKVITVNLQSSEGDKHRTDLQSQTFVIVWHISILILKTQVLAQVFFKFRMTMSSYCICMILNNYCMNTTEFLVSDFNRP
jgi:hypothetical protein